MRKEMEEFGAQLRFVLDVTRDMSSGLEPLMARLYDEYVKLLELVDEESVGEKMEVMNLSKKEKLLFEVLYKNQGREVGVETLLYEVYGGGGQVGTLQKLAERLRESLAGTEWDLVSVRNRGYMLRKGWRNGGERS